MYHQVNIQQMYHKPNCIYILCINLKTYSDMCHLLHKLIEFVT